MDLNYILIWSTCTLIIVSLLQIFRASIKNYRGWIFKYVFILIITLTGIFLYKNITGYIGSGLLIIFVIIPTVAYKYITRFWLKYQHKKAIFIARVIAFLHPFDGWKDYPGILASVFLAEKGDFNQARISLESYVAKNRDIGFLAKIYLVRIRDNWLGFVRWIKALEQTDLLKRQPVLLCEYLRALGEINNVSEMLNVFKKYEKFINTQPMSIQNKCLIYVLAFSGKCDDLELLFKGMPHNAETKNLWISTALLAAGESDRAENNLQELIKSKNGLVSMYGEKRLTQANAYLIAGLSGDDSLFFQKIRENISLRSRYNFNGKLKLLSATLLIIFTNLVFFIFEIARGGSENVNVLYKMGALVPADAIAGEWWRVIFSIFLHYGPIHLIMNMLALFIFGKYIERVIGTIKFIIVYFCSGLGSMILFIILSLIISGENEILVGASGCIMGLVGARAALLLKGWRLHKADIAKRQFFILIAFIIVQTIFDLSTPQVSFIGHFAGFLIGFITVMLFKYKKSEYIH